MQSHTAIHAALAAIVGLAAQTALATDIPLECTTGGNGNWTITTDGRFDALCPGGPGECTGIEYLITRNFGKSPDHVALLVEHDANVLVPGSRNVNPPGTGDGPTNLGRHDFSTQAVRINENAETGTFELLVDGRKFETTGSIVVKKGNITEACRIATLGTDFVLFDPNAQRPANTVIDFKGCMVNIPTDTTTGEGGVATITGENCVFVANASSVDAAELSVNGQSVGTLTFGNGALSSGTSSCTTRIINRRIYTWCTCEDVDGDNVPDDPIPPCPPTLPE